MTQDEIIEMARQAGLLVIGTSNGADAVYTWPAGITDEIEAFAKLVAEKEREACAEICDEFFKGNKSINYSDTIAICIRARAKA
jgi:hypothetical protein